MIGAESRASWEEEQVRLLPGDMVITVSSGVLGARNVTGQPFGPARLSECVAERRRQPLDSLTEGIVRAVVAWTGRPVPTDDLSVLAVRFAPGC
jgi:sigma-B regulation protein RsbU (phosphoserine phosphatase)